MSGKKSRMMRRAYNKVKALKPARNLFDLSHEWLATGDMGKLYPCCYMEMSPGDTFHIWQQIVTRMQPLNAPILHEIFLYTHFFFVPYRILMEEWTEFITGSVEGDKGGTERTDYEETLDGKVIDYPSEVSPELPRWIPTNNAVGSLWDYCGFPTGVKPAGAYPLDFIRRCYNRIWNEYYRDENLQEEVSEENEEILYRNWKKDYFTSALLSQQRGVSPAMPVVGRAPVTQDITTVNGTFDIRNPDGFIVRFAVPESVPVTDMRFSACFAYFSDLSETPPVESGSWAQFARITDRSSNEVSAFYIFSERLPNSYDVFERFQESAFPTLSYSVFDNIDFEDNVGFDVKDLRQAFQIQKWLELANRGGVRYTEFLRSFFGVSPRDDRLQRPEYIGGTKSPMIISEVLQTSATNNEPTPQGNMAGHGVGASRTYVGSYTATEYGIVMGLLSVMPTTKYTQGINKQWLRRSKYDFLFPQFTGLSEQAIEQAEIYATNDESQNKKVFGFNEIYDELRSMSSKIVGKMRTVFNYWHLARIFDSAPALNSDFIKCQPSKRIFAVQNEDGFIFDVANIIRAVRPIPKYGTPKGV